MAHVSRGRKKIRQRGERAAPSTVPLLTASDLAALKPVLVVRTRGEFGRQLAIWVGVYFAAIWLLALFWFLRGVRGDGVLLAAAHFLTAIAFCPLAARPDPLRDTMLFASCARTLTAGITLMGIVSLVNFRKAAFLTLSYVSIDRGAGLCAVLNSVWQRARQRQREGESRSHTANRSNPPAACTLPRRLLRSTMGADPPDRFKVDSRLHVAVMAATATTGAMLPVVGGVGAALMCSSRKKTWGRRSFSRVSSSRCTPWRAIAWVSHSGAWQHWLRVFSLATD